MSKVNEKKIWDSYNNLVNSEDIGRLKKILVRYELFKKSIEVPGDIVECGVFKGTSFLLFCKFLKIYDSNSIKKIIGFDTFGKFPSTTLKYEKKSAKEFIKESKFKSNNNDLTIFKKANKILEKNKIQLIKGDITKTAKGYVKKNKGFRISLLHLDLDTYHGTKSALENFYPLVSKGGLIVIDEYSSRGWGESDAIDEFFSLKKVKIKSIPFSTKPTAFIIKP